MRDHAEQDQEDPEDDRVAGGFNAQRVPDSVSSLAMLSPSLTLLPLRCPRERVVITLHDKNQACARFLFVNPPMTMRAGEGVGSVVTLVEHLAKVLRVRGAITPHFRRQRLS